MERHKKRCISCGKMSYIYSHGECLSCAKKTYAKNKKEIYRRKARKPIKRVSEKQKERNLLYRDARRRRIDIESREGKINCFFCGESIDSGRIDCHHLLGRDGGRIAELKNLVLAHPDCHNGPQGWHNAPLSDLILRPWWDDFMKRLKKQNTEAYENVIYNLLKNNLPYKAPWNKK